jgi:hypothetical protein
MLALLDALRGAGRAAAPAVVRAALLRRRALRLRAACWGPASTGACKGRPDVLGAAPLLLALQQAWLWVRASLRVDGASQGLPPLGDERSATSSGGRRTPSGCCCCCWWWGSTGRWCMAVCAVGQLQQPLGWWFSAVIGAH